MKSDSILHGTVDIFITYLGIFTIRILLIYSLRILWYIFYYIYSEYTHSRLGPRLKTEKAKKLKRSHPKLKRQDSSTDASRSSSSSSSSSPSSSSSASTSSSDESRSKRRRRSSSDSEDTKGGNLGDALLARLARTKSKNSNKKTKNTC